MVKDANGREGLSTGAIAKELEVSPAAVKKALDDPQGDGGRLREGWLRLLLRGSAASHPRGPQVGRRPQDSGVPS